MKAISPGPHAEATDLVARLCAVAGTEADVLDVIKELSAAVGEDEAVSIAALALIVVFIDCLPAPVTPIPAAPTTKENHS